MTFWEVQGQGSRWIYLNKHSLQEFWMSTNRFVFLAQSLALFHAGCFSWGSVTKLKGSLEAIRRGFKKEVFQFDVFQHSLQLFAGFPRSIQARLAYVSIWGEGWLTKLRSPGVSVALSRICYTLWRYAFVGPLSIEMNGPFYACSDFWMTSGCNSKVK